MLQLLLLLLLLFLLLLDATVTAAVDDAIVVYDAVVVGAIVKGHSLTLYVVQIIASPLQMGMMKEHVRGPIQCCETIASDMLHLIRAEELVHHTEFKSVDVGMKQRKQVDSLGGLLPSRVLGAPIKKTDSDVLNRLLRDFLVGISGGWEEDDYAHEGLVIEEYTKASIGSSTYFTVDWKFDEKATANYFLYYSSPRLEVIGDSGEPQPPSLQDLESLEKPPPDYSQQLHDYYNYNCVGQVIAGLVQMMLFYFPSAGC